jgi:O-antigen ligase
MLLWWLWMAVEITVFSSPEKRALFRNLTCYVMFPLPAALLIAHERARIERFAYAHIVTTLVGGLFAFEKLGLSLADLLGNPTLNNTNIVRLNIANYHWFAYGYAVSLILSVTLYLQARRAGTRLVLGLVAAANIYMLFLSGSRQALNGSALLVVLMCLWALGRAQIPRARTLLLLLPGAGLGVALFLAAPQLIVRPGEGGFLDTLDITGDRGGLWMAGLEYFYQSPLWGAGFEHTNYAHNVLIGALADQGLVGLAFLLGTLAFFAQCCRGLWRGLGDLAVWRMGFAMVGCFSLITGLVSSDTLSIWYFYLASAVLWRLGQLDTPALHAEQATARPAQPAATQIRA